MPEIRVRPVDDAPADRAPSRGFQPIRDLPTFVWLLVLVVAAVLHRQLPVAGWLMLHLLFLGAATHAILVWSQHFTIALTRTPLTFTDRRWQNVRLALANLGALGVLVGVPLGVWAATVAGAALLIVAVLWHGASLVRRMRGALRGRFARTVRYYVASAAFLPFGSAIGAWMASGDDSLGVLGGSWSLAHAIINVFGWIGITVAGTLVTLWPTMLRTKADDRSPERAARALPVLAIGVLVAAAGAALGWSSLAAFGFSAYALGLVMLAAGFLAAARRTAPTGFSTLSAAAAFGWWVVCLLVLTVQSVRAALTTGPAGGIEVLQETLNWAAPYLAAGFVAQILVGALSYLVPVALGGGPAPVKAGTAVFDRGAGLRVATANAALVVCALPVTSITRVAASVLYLIAMASFLGIMVAAMRSQSRVKRGGTGGGGAAAAEGARTGTLRPPRGRLAGQAMAGLVAVMMVAVITTAVQPQSLGAVTGSAWQMGGGGSDGADGESAPVRTVRVEAADMRFTPDRIEVPVGTRLVIELTNTDAELVHDLVFENGAGGTRLAPGESTTIDVGAITGDLAGWCSIVGHRQMGMTLDIVATGEGAGSAAPGSHEHHGNSNGGGKSGPSAAELINFAKDPPADFAARDARLEPLPAASGPTTHRITLPVTEQVVEVAPGVRQRLWTFGGTAPGPTLHGRVGDTFVVTLVNDGTIGHSIDFHAGALAPDQPMRTIAPGESLTYTFTATRSGMWMYHCSTMPMSAHIANGMYGAVVVEPDDLPEVDRSFVLVQGEAYLGPQDGEVDMDRLASGVPDLVTFNGYANQYGHEPLAAKAGERVRFWVLDAGPNRASSFHVVGGQFDTVWSEGRYLINRARDTGSQALALQPAQGGFVELTFPEAGHYPFVTHLMSDAERGARGIVDVR